MIALMAKPCTEIGHFGIGAGIRRADRFVSWSWRACGYRFFLSIASAPLLLISVCAQQLPSGPGQQGASCSLLSRSGPAQTEWKDEDLLTAYTSEAARIRSLDMTAMVRASAGAEYG